MPAWPYRPFDLGVLAPVAVVDERPERQLGPVDGESADAMVISASVYTARAGPPTA